MKKRFVIIITFIAISLLISCQIPVDRTINLQISTVSSINGKIISADKSPHSGITVTLEKADSIISLTTISAVQNISTGTAQETVLNDGIRSIGLSKNIAGQTTTNANGFYSFLNIEPGIYTIYAASPNVKESAVLKNIILEPNTSLTAPLMMTTSTGAISGRIILDNKETGNYGFLLCVEGTSFMALSDFYGNFIINNVPEDYHRVIIMKDNYLDFYSTNYLYVYDDINPIFLIPVEKHITSEDLYTHPIKAAINRLITEAKLTKNGLSPANALNLDFQGTGVDLSDDISMKYVFDAIQGYYVHLNFSKVKGDYFFCYPVSAGTDKTKILSVTLSNSVKEICGEIPSTLTIKGAFQNFTSLQAITAPGVIKIGNRAFENCTSLSSVNFPLAENIGDYAFYNCTNLGTAAFSGVKPISIGNYTFYNCKKLVSAIYSDVTIIGDYAFHACSELVNAEFYKAYNIGKYAFYDCKKLKNAVSTIAKGRASVINKCSFYNCSSIKNALFPNAYDIDDYAFYGCTSLESIEFPLIRKIGAYAFYNCKEMKFTLFPNSSAYGVRTIGESAFYNCSSLVNAEFPLLTIINPWTFFNCKSLITISNSPNVTNIKAGAFYNCTGLETASFPNTTSIGDCAFFNCENLILLDITNIISIGAGAFQQCTSLFSIEAPHLTTISENAFAGCKKLMLVNIPMVTSIGHMAFFNCELLAYIVLGVQPPYLGGYVFCGSRLVPSYIFRPIACMNIYIVWKVLFEENFISDVYFVDS